MVNIGSIFLFHSPHQNLWNEQGGFNKAPPNSQALIVESGQGLGGNNSQPDLGRELNGAGGSKMRPQLDTPPFTTMLEKLQETVAQRRKRVETTTTSISSLKLQLRNTSHSIKLKQGEEEQLRKTTDGVKAAFDELRIETEQLECKVKEANRARAKLRHELQIRRHMLRAVRLAERAIKKEMEGCNAAAAATQHHIKCIRSDEKMIELPYNEYCILRNKAENIVYAHPLGSSLEKERQAAEIRRASALRRLKALHEDTQPKPIHKQGGVVIEDTVKGEAKSRTIARDGRSTKANSAIQHMEMRASRIDANRRVQQRNIRRSNGGSNDTLVQRKKPSIFKKIQSLLIKKIRFFSHRR